MRNALKQGVWEQFRSSTCPQDLLDVLKPSILHTEQFLGLLPMCFFFEVRIFLN